jgi:hypothetical protein
LSLKGQQVPRLQAFRDFLVLQDCQDLRVLQELQDQQVLKGIQVFQEDC